MGFAMSGKEALGQFYTACFSLTELNNNNKYMKRTPYKSIFKIHLGRLQN